MPLDGGDNASQPPGTTAVTLTPADSSDYNAVIADIYSILNTVRSIGKGYTAATTAAGALKNFITGTVAETTIDDADHLVFSDTSVNSGDGKKITWANFKAFISNALNGWTVISTDAGAAAGPTTEKFRDSVSPAANDLGGYDAYTGRTSTGAKATYADDYLQIVSPTNASYGGQRIFRVAVNAALVNRLVLNAAGADVTGALTTTGAISAAASVNAITTLSVRAASGNAHVYFMDPTNTVARAIIYTAMSPAGHLVFQNSAGQAWQMGTDAVFYAPGQLRANAAIYGTDGNIAGTVWSSWGAGDSFNAINLRIEARADAYATLRANAAQNVSVTSTRSAGFITFDFAGDGTYVDLGVGYYVTGAQRVNGTAGRYVFGARQPQVFYGLFGWVVAFGW